MIINEIKKDAREVQYIISVVLTINTCWAMGQPTYIQKPKTCLPYNGLIFEIVTQS